MISGKPLQRDPTGSRDLRPWTRNNFDMGEIIPSNQWARLLGSFGNVFIWTFLIEPFKKGSWG